MPAEIFWLPVPASIFCRPEPAEIFWGPAPAEICWRPAPAEVFWQPATAGRQIAKENIFKWMQHLKCHTQQNIGKHDVMEKLDDHSCLWFRDYCQKILPMQFRESQFSYFGQKGMSLHANVMLMKVNDEILKQTYFTTAYRCDQGNRRFTEYC